MNYATFYNQPQPAGPAVVNASVLRGMALPVKKQRQLSTPKRGSFAAIETQLCTDIQSSDAFL